MIYLTWDDGPSQLAITVFCVVIVMIMIGWLWALWRSYNSHSSYASRSRCRPRCKSCCRCKCCFCCCHLLGGRYKYYPWDCLRDFFKFLCCGCCKKGYNECEKCPSYCETENETSSLPFGNRVVHIQPSMQQKVS